MKITLIGTGPAISIRGRGKNYRTTSSMVLSHNNKNILFDATPSVEEQLNANDIGSIDAVVLSHGHHSVISGLRYCSNSFGKLPIYALSETFDVIDDHYECLDYDKNIIESDNMFNIFDVDITPFKVLHAESFKTNIKYPCLGFRVLNTAYAGEMEGVEDTYKKYLFDLDNLIIDASMYDNRKIKGHMNTTQALSLIRELRPKMAILTQIGNGYPDYHKSNKYLLEQCDTSGINSKVVISYDGMSIDISQKKNLRGLERIGICMKNQSPELLMENEIKIIVDCKLYKNMINKPLYLLDNKNCYGIIELTKIRKTNIEELKLLVEYHKIDEENLKCYIESDSYIYEFVIKEKFVSPKSVDELKGSSFIIEDFKFSKYENADFRGHTRSIDMIENTYEYNPSGIDNKPMLDDLRILISMYSKHKRGNNTKISGEQIVSLATKIFKEISNRKKKNRLKWTSTPEIRSEAYRDLWGSVDLSDEDRNILTTRIMPV